MSKAKFGILHNHSEYSIRDSSMTITRMFERAKELEAPAVALTDHGILTGTIDFLKAAKEYGIKGIPGIEAYYIPTAEFNNRGHHLILMAKDWQGYTAICHAQKLAYDNIVHEAPCMDKDILKKVFGPGSDGHGHVIATSACVGGILARILLEDEELVKSTEKLRNKQMKYHPVDDEIQDIQMKLDEFDANLDDLIKRRDELDSCKINVTGLKRVLRSLKPEDDEYANAEKAVNDALAKKEDIANELKTVKKEIADTRRARTAFKTAESKKLDSAEKWIDVQNQIDAIVNTKQGEETLYAKAKAECVDFNDIFGEGNFYVELQYHRILNEKYVMPLLAKIAAETNVPVVAANDAHYASNSRDEIRARTLISALRFNKEIEEGGEGYGELYMKGDDELLAYLSEVIPPEVAQTAIENIGKIVDSCNVELPHEKHYPVYPTDGTETAAQRLRRLANEGIANRYPSKQWTPEFEKRMNYELDIIDNMGFSDYLCIVQDYLDYGRQLGFDCPEKIGYTIGPGRGSAAGSIVCYLVGITDIDPMRYGLLFERFLNPERVSMPDIDADFAPEVRDKVIEYVQEKYRSTDPVVRAEGTPICSIITKGTLAARGAIKSAARVTNIPISLAESMSNQVPLAPHVKIDDIPNLDEQCNANPVIKQLIADAKLIEGLTVNYGMHAAGVIIADNGDVGKYVPLYRNITRNGATGPWIAQLDMVQCEGDAGLLKMDFLGLNNLDIITDTIRRVKRNNGIEIDIQHIPEEKEVFAKIFSNGNTDTVFQFESGGMKDMLRQFKPGNMEDIVLLVAAYRPGPMQFIPDIIKVKHGQMKPHYIADGLEEILKETYGYPIYQEQVMQIFNKIGGFSLGESDVIRRAMSKKKLAVLTDPKTNYKGKFMDGLMKHGATMQDAEAFWEQLLDFANYAFNKSHAACYATISYMTAWLKYHYPAEYMCSVMSRTTFGKLPLLVNNCRKMNLRILQPNINLSQDGFVNDDDRIMFGFGNIKGLGSSGAEIVAERNENGAFNSVKDFVVRMISGSHSKAYDKTTMENLIKSGAFDEFCDGNRASLLDSIEEFGEATKKMLEKKRIYAERKELLDQMDDATPAADRKKAERAVTNAIKSMEAANELYGQHNFVLVQEDIGKKLDEEYKLLGMYLSGNPFSEYSDAAKALKNRTEITDVYSAQEKSVVTICGLIKDIKKLQRKSDGRQFATFQLFDDTGEIEVKCFTKAFATYGEFVEENVAVAITGYVSVDKMVLDDGSVQELGVNVSVKEMSVLKRNANELMIISGDTVFDWQDNYETIKKYVSPSGYQAVFTDKFNGMIRKTGLILSKDILNAELPGLKITLTRV